VWAPCGCGVGMGDGEDERRRGCADVDAWKVLTVETGRGWVVGGRCGWCNVRVVTSSREGTGGVAV